MRRYRSRLRRAIAAHPTSEHAFSSSLIDGALLPTVTTRDRPQKGRLPTLTATTYGSNQGGAASGPQRVSLRRLVPPLMTTRATYMRYPTKGGPVKVVMLPGMVDGPLSPRWLEWFMGFPDGWLTSTP